LVGESNNIEKRNPDIPGYVRVKGKLSRQKLVNRKKEAPKIIPKIKKKMPEEFVAL